MQSEAWSSVGASTLGTFSRTEHGVMIDNVCF